MNWKQLKEFCNSLDEEQLETNVILSIDDEESISNIEAEITEKGKKPFLWEEL